MDTQTSSQTQNADTLKLATKLNLTEIIEDMFLVLTSKEKEVIIKRFSLDSQPKQTLEKIGQFFSVTRERIRQIEKIALGKLRRTAVNTRLSLINKLAHEILEKNGGVLLEEKLTAEILNQICSNEKVDAAIIKLAFNINPEIVKSDKTNVFKPFWRFGNISFEDVKMIVDTAMEILHKKGDVIHEGKLSEEVSERTSHGGKKYSSEAVLSSIEVDKRIKRLKEGGFGLLIWRHINPRSIRDKAYIVLKKIGDPLHFVDIANKISETGFDKKVVTTQAVHNELIRYEQFVLVGRGLYALKEWGYKKGTVADVIEDLLKKKNPLTKQEIMQGVLKQRQVKKGTISLNLQKNPQFVRVGRAVYQLDENKKVHA